MVVLKKRGREMSSKMLRTTRGGNVRRKFKKCMDLFLVEGGMCSYDNEIDGDKEVPLRYKHYVKNWEPNPLPKLDINFCIDGRTY
jgi:hypothetical protein